MKALLILALISIMLMVSLRAFAGNNGQFKLVYTMPKNEIYRNIGVVFKNSDQFQSIIEGLNREFILPANIMVEFDDKNGPVYDPNTKTITMSYEFIYYLSIVYIKQYPKASNEEMIQFTLSSTTFLLYHEIAHALIDVYKLPIVSNEEAAADNLAVILALEYTNDGYDIVMDSAELFDLFNRSTTSYKEDDLWDEHALDAQRFYNIVCLTYGKYPEKVLAELKKAKNKKLVKFINEKGDYCKQEYNRQMEAWSVLLDSHMTTKEARAEAWLHEGS